MPAEKADKALTRMWNQLVGHRMRYTASFLEMSRDGKDALVKYHAGEMIRLLDERGEGSRRLTMI